MESKIVILKIVKSDIYGKVGKIVATFENRVMAEVSASAMNRTITENWYKGDKDCAYVAVPTERITSYAINCGIHLTDLN